MYITGDNQQIKRKKSKNIILVKPNNETKYVIASYQPNLLDSALSNSEQQLRESKQTSNVCNSDEICAYCCANLKEPYIRCYECSILLCCKCFACGREVKQHCNNHSYIIVRDDMQVFPDAHEWTAKQERLLLLALQQQGYGNWSAIAKQVGADKSAEECKQHYHDYYFGGIFEKLLGLAHASQCYFPERMPYAVRMRCMDPPRHDDITSMQFKMLAGYRAARGDFDIPYDVSAESILTTIMQNEGYPIEDDASLEFVYNEDYEEIENELKMGLVRAYNNRLRFDIGVYFTNIKFILSFKGSANVVIR